MVYFALYVLRATEEAALPGFELEGVGVVPLLELDRLAQVAVGAEARVSLQLEIVLIGHDVVYPQGVHRVVEAG